MYVLLLITATTIGTVTVQQLGTSAICSPAKLRPRNNSLLRECCKSRQCIFAASVSGIADGTPAAGASVAHKRPEVSWPAATISVG